MKKNAVFLLHFCVFLACKPGAVTYPIGLQSPVDAQIAPCDTGENSLGHQCLIISEPYLKRFSVLDLSIEQFVLSPIGYWPLSIGYGGEEGLLGEFLQPLGEGNFVYIKDAQNPRLWKIKTDFPGFHKAEGIDLPGVLHRGLVVYPKEGEPWLWMSLDKPPAVARSPFDKATGLPKSIKADTVRTSILDFAVSATDGQVVEIFSNGFQWYQLEKNGALKLKKNIQYNVKGGIVKSFLSPFRLGDKEEWFVFLLREEGIDIYSLDQARLLFQVSLKEAAKLYVPHGRDWFLLSTLEGRMRYVSLETLLAQKDLEKATRASFNLNQMPSLLGRGKLDQLATLVGGSIHNTIGRSCSEDRAVIFVFGTGQVVKICEGSTNLEDFRLIGY